MPPDDSEAPTGHPLDHRPPQAANHDGQSKKRKNEEHDMAGAKDDEPFGQKQTATERTQRQPTLAPSDPLRANGFRTR